MRSRRLTGRSCRASCSMTLTSEPCTAITTTTVMARLPKPPRRAAHADTGHPVLFREYMSVSNRYVLVSPCRNEAAFMRQTLASVLAQTLRPSEWVVVDDG